MIKNSKTGVLTILLTISIQLITAQNTNMARLYYSQKKYDLAAREFEKCLPFEKKERGVKDTVVYAKLLFYAAISFEQINNLSKAEKYYLECISVYKRTRRPNGKTYRGACYSLANLYTKTNRPQKAIPLAIELKGIIRKELGTNNQLYADQCNFLAANYRKTGQLKQATSMLIEFESIYLKLFGENHTNLITVYNNLGVHYKTIGHFDKAEKYLSKGNRLITDSIGKDNIGYAKSSSNLATLYTELGKYDKAEQLFILSIPIIDSLLGKENRNYISTCHNLAGVYKETGRYSKAEELYLSINKLIKKKYGEKDRYYAKNIGYLGTLYLQLDNFKKALPLLIDSKILLDSLVGNEHYDYAFSCNNLALAYFNMGNHSKAEKLYFEAHKIKEQVFGKLHPTYAMSCHNLGGFYMETASYNKAEKMFLESMSIIGNSLGKKNHLYLLSCNSLALDYYYQKKYSLAEQYFLETKDIYAEKFGTNDIKYAASCNLLAGLYSETKELDKALENFKIAKKIRLEKLGRYHTQYASSCTGLSTVYRKQNKNDEAIQLLEEAKLIYDSILGKSHYDYAIVCANLSLAYQHNSESEKAKKNLMEANDAIDSLLRESEKYMSEKEYNILIRRKVNTMYNHFFSTYLKEYSNDSILTNRAFNNSLLIKNKLLQSSIALRNTVNTSNSQGLKDTLDILNKLGKTIAHKFALPNAHIDTHLQKLKLKHTQIEKYIASEVSKRFGITNSTPDWKLLSKQLDENEAVVQFINFGYLLNENWTDSLLYYALILKKDEAPKAVYLFEEKELYNLIKRQAHENDYSFVKKLYSKESPESKQLYKQVFEPLEKHLLNIKKVYISPVGLLNQIAFDAIVCDSTNIILDKYDIFYSSLGKIKESKQGLYKKDLKNIEIYGGVNYELTPSEMRALSSNYKEEEFLVENIAPEIDQAQRNVTWSYLPGSLKEMQSIKTVLKDKLAINSFTGKEASEEQFRAMETEPPSVIHIATHGFYFGFDDKSNFYREMIDEEVKFAHSSNPLLRSGFILAGGNNAFQGIEPPEGVGDGVVTALEVSRMNLFNTKLAVLSACQTGLGDVKGHEGVYGLQRAFKMAGVEYLLFSLWEVPDYQTEELMTQFYKNWFNGMEIKKAFKQAQLYLKNKYKKMKGSAFAWAAFVLMN